LSAAAIAGAVGKALAADFQFRNKTAPTANASTNVVAVAIRASEKRLIPPPI